MENVPTVKSAKTKLLIAASYYAPAIGGSEKVRRRNGEPVYDCAELQTVNRLMHEEVTITQANVSHD
jgi:hypothetical protein